MPTEDGRKPTQIQIENDSLILKNKINELIKDFKKIYNEPSIVLKEGSEYRIKTLVIGPLLDEQYNNKINSGSFNHESCTDEFNILMNKTK